MLLMYKYCIITTVPCYSPSLASQKSRDPPTDTPPPRLNPDAGRLRQGMWATARLIATVGCENVHLRCDATDVAYVEKSCWNRAEVGDG